LIWLLLFPAILYACGWFYVGLQLKGWHKKQMHKEKQTISIIVPFRNEALHIERLLTELYLQTQLPEQVILINDDSIDNGDKLVSAWLKKHENDLRINKWELIENKGEGKKSAIATGVTEAKTEWIITLDADVHLQPIWLSEFSKYLTNKTAGVAGWVSLTGKNIAQRCQQIEFSMLLASGFVNLSNQKPGMLSGAHFAFRREIFEKLNGYKGNDEIASGDDEFLVRKIIEAKEKVEICLDENTSVNTRANPYLKEIISQRVRWAGKWKHHKDWQTKSLAVGVALLQMYWIATIFLLVFNPVTFGLTTGSIWLVKMLAEIFVLYIVSNKMKQRFSAPAFLLMQAIYPFLVWVIVLATFSKATTWKGRKIKL
jgi:cellulose synthase/poly-beta-1,6-N-acetylglucosamine synthase-like glycosyltransferase